MLNKKEFENYNSFVVIDLDNLKHNLELSKKKAGGAYILAVVKADAYNHGSEMIAKKLYEWGVCHFAVANIDEALELRRAGVGGMILVLSPMPVSRYDDAVKNDISVTADSVGTLAAICGFAKENNKKIKLHLALNTGMNRIGFKIGHGRLSEELVSAKELIISEKNVIPEGIFSHLCDADNSDTAFTELQLRRFGETVSLLSKEGVDFRFRHICNSAGTVFFGEPKFDLVRCGIILYGCEFSEYGVLPVMSFITRISETFSVKKGETIGYGRSYTADHDMRVATISAGYADGYSRQLSNTGYVLCHGKKAPIVGRVCMDMTMIDVTDIPEAQVFDPVTLLGKNGDLSIHAEELAVLCDTISYEILCRVGKRLKRFYIENGEIVDNIM